MGIANGCSEDAGGATFLKLGYQKTGKVGCGFHQDLDESETARNLFLSQEVLDNILFYYSRSHVIRISAILPSRYKLIKATLNLVTNFLSVYFFEKPM